MIHPIDYTHWKNKLYENRLKICAPIILGIGIVAGALIQYRWGIQNKLQWKRQNIGKLRAITTFFNGYRVGDIILFEKDDQSPMVLIGNIRNSKFNQCGVITECFWGFQHGEQCID